MPRILITGANRGLGLEFTRQYAVLGWEVLACCRHPEEASELQTLSRIHKNIKLESLNVYDFNQIDSLSSKLSNVTIDILLNNAGVYGDHSNFGHLDYQVWLNTLVINTQAPIKVAESFLNNLKQGEHKLLVSISSLMGSMTDNQSGGSIMYRSSKAALNAAMKSLAIDLRGQNIGVLLLHPGWVKTDMGGPNALIDARTSVSGMISVINGFSINQSGSFLKYDGTLLPW